jgi:hypothetical protein
MFGLNLSGLRVLHEYYCRLFSSHGGSGRRGFGESLSENKDLVHNWLQLSLVLAEEAASSSTTPVSAADSPDPDTLGAASYLAAVQHILFSSAASTSSSCAEVDTTCAGGFSYSRAVASTLCAAYNYEADWSAQRKDGLLDVAPSTEPNGAVAGDGDCVVGSGEEISELFLKAPRASVSSA